MPDNPVKDAIEALYKPIESIVKTLAGPAAEEIGLSFRDSVQAWRLKRQIRLFERVTEFCHDAGIKPQAVKLPLLFDVVGKASLEEDDELQDMWAALLANAANPKRESLVSSAFPDTLRQLSKAEAIFLDHLDRALNWAPPGRYIRVEKPDAHSLSPLHKENLKRLGLIDNVKNPQLTTFGRAFVDACQPPEPSKEMSKARRRKQTQNPGR